MRMAFNMMNGLPFVIESAKVCRPFRAVVKNDPQQGFRYAPPPACNLNAPTLTLQSIIRVLNNS